MTNTYMFSCHSASISLLLIAVWSEKDVKLSSWNSKHTIFTKSKHYLLSTYRLRLIWLAETVLLFIIFPFLSTRSTASALLSFGDPVLLELCRYVLITPNITIRTNSAMLPPTIQWICCTFSCISDVLVVEESVGNWTKINILTEILLSRYQLQLLSNSPRLISYLQVCLEISAFCKGRCCCVPCPLWSCTLIGLASLGHLVVFLDLGYYHLPVQYDWIQWFH